MYDNTKVTAATVRQVVTDAIAEGDALLAEVVAVAGDRTFRNTIAPFDRVGVAHARAFAQGAFMAHVHPDAEVRTAASQAEAELERWHKAIVFRRDLFDAVEAFAASPAADQLDGDEARLLAHLRRDLRRAGHALAPEAREELRDLSDRLVDLEVGFQTNIGAFKDGIEVTRDDLEGMPDPWIDGLAEGSQPGTFVVSLDYPELQPFLDQSPRRDLREELHRRSQNKATEQNRPLLEEAVRLRRRVAELFGLASWADHQLEPRMAEDLAAVDAFHADLVPAVAAKAEDELADLAAHNDGEPVQRWDFRYLHTAIKRERFGIDPNEVAAYFPLQATLDGMFAITEEVFGLSYRQIDAPVWHPEVTTWEMLDRESGETLARFHLDLHPREGTFGHAAVFPLRDAYETDDGVVLPECAMIANFTRPTADRPSLLQHGEVVVLFHEFGHVLHACLGRSRFQRFSGVGVERDFAEAPSQIFEHWCWTPHVLQRFARHHETGEPIPEALVAQLVAARDLHVAMFTLRQLELGLVDLALHGTGDLDHLDALVADVAAEVGFLPLQEGTFFPTGWGHIMGGYDAGYYGYLWSKVFGDDMFSRFSAEGELNPATGRDYRRAVLERGGTKDAVELLRDFLGREPNRDAFLAQLGIEAPTP